MNGACTGNGFGTCEPYYSGPVDGGTPCAFEVAIPAVGGSGDVCHITITSATGAVFQVDVPVVSDVSTVGNCTSLSVRLADPSQETITVVFPDASGTDGGLSDARASSSR